MFQLKQVDPYRIEPTEEHIPGAQDNSYAEMIRVRGSKPEPPHYVVPSHLYKYSETELGLYLHERKNLWRELGKLLEIKIDISDREIMANFPISLFPDVAKIVPFVKKRGSFRNPELAKRFGRNTQFAKGTRHKHKESRSEFNERAPVSNSIPPLERFAIKEGTE